MQLRLAARALVASFAACAAASLALLIAPGGAAAVLFAARAAAAEETIPPAPVQWVTDNAGFLSAPAQQALNARLRAYEARTGHQVIVWIGATTGDTPLEEWTANAFAQWKVGRKKLDDGVALFLFASDRKVRIEVGYGLEAQLTDAQSSRIIRNVIVPKIRAGDRDGAVAGGVDAIIASIETPQSATANPQPQSEPAAWAGGALLLFGLLLFVLFNVPMWMAWRAYTIQSRRHGGSFGYGPFWLGGLGGGFGGFLGGGGLSGGGFSGGGFSGGGGTSGGGGASGGW